MTNITVDQLKQWRESDESGPIVLDVREPWELNLCRLPDTLDIPMRQVPARLAELDREQEIAVLCHHGIRSRQVAYFLEQQGFGKVFNVHGGINAWARMVDPAMPRY